MSFAKFSWFPVAMSLAACQVMEEPPEDDGGQSGTAMPDGCVEDHRVAVVDPTVASEGFDHTPDEAIALFAGQWEGSGTLASGDPIDVSLAVDHDGGPIEAVYLVWHESGVGEGPPMGAPASTTAQTCEPYYAFGVVTSLSALPWLEADGAGELMGTMGQAQYFVAETPLDEVTGDLAPTYDTTMWDSNALAVSFDRGVDGSSWVSLLWWGENDVAEQAPATSTGTVSTGTVEPSGVSESIASMQVTRVAD